MTLDQAGTGLILGDAAAAGNAATQQQQQQQQMNMFSDMGKQSVHHENMKVILDLLTFNDLCYLL